MSNNILDDSSDSLLFQDAVETPEEQWSKNQFNSNAEISWQLLVGGDSNSKLNDLLSAERRNNLSLINEHASLKIEIFKIKNKIAGQYLSISQ